MLNLQFFTQNTHPLLILQSNKPCAEFCVNIKDLNIKCGDTIRDVDINKALNSYIGLGNKLDSDIKFKHKCNDSIVFYVNLSPKRSVNFSENDNISSTYIVDLLLKFKVVFITNIPKHFYHKILEDINNEWRRKFLGQDSNARMRQFNEKH